MLAIDYRRIDLSVSLPPLYRSFAALILTKVRSRDASNALFVLAIAAVIAFSVPCGLLNGVLIAFVGVPPILATLGTQGLYLGLATIITKGLSIASFPEQFLFIGAGSIFGIPVVFILFILGTIVVALLLGRTQQGFSMFMLGSNPTVSPYSGMDNSNVIIKPYMITALLASISSIIMISRRPTQYAQATAHPTCYSNLGRCAWWS